MTRIAWVHGYTMDSRIWQPLWDLMPEHEHVGVELPGHGRFRDEPMPRSLSGWAQHVADQLREADARTVVSLSFGSSVALQAAVEHPDLVDRLVMGAPTLSGVPDDEEARRKYFLLATSIGRLGPGPLLAQIWMSDPPRIFTGLREHPAAYEHMRSVVSDHPFAELLTGAMGDLNQTVQDADLLARVRCPLLVMTGTEDMPQFVENARLLESAVADCRSVTMEGAGHLPMLEMPERSAQLLADFVGARAAA